MGTMTLEKVRDVLREMNEVGYWYSHRNSMHIPVMRMADAIDAHLSQPQPVAQGEAVATLERYGDAVSELDEKLRQILASDNYRIDGDTNQLLDRMHHAMISYRDLVNLQKSVIANYEEQLNHKNV